MDATATGPGRTPILPRDGQGEAPRAPVYQGPETSPSQLGCLVPPALRAVTALPRGPRELRGVPPPGPACFRELLPGLQRHPGHPSSCTASRGSLP